MVVTRTCGLRVCAMCFYCLQRYLQRALEEFADNTRKSDERTENEKWVGEARTAYNKVCSSVSLVGGGGGAAAAAVS